MRHIFATTLAALLFVLNAFAQVNLESNKTLPFTRMALDPVSASMGEALKSDNPLLRLTEPGKLSAEFVMGSLFPAVSKEAITSGDIGTKIGDKLAFTASYMSGKGEAYEVFDKTGNLKGTYSPTDMMLRFGASMGFGKSFGAGVVFSYAKSTLAKDYSLSAISFDVLAQYSGDCFVAGGGVRNIGPALESEAGQKFPLASSVNLYGAWNHMISSVVLKAVSDADVYLDGGVTICPAIEATFIGIATLRAGYHIAAGAAPIPSFASAGLGVKYLGVSLNAAYLFASPTLGGSLLAGLSYSF